MTITGWHGPYQNLTSKVIKGTLQITARFLITGNCFPSGCKLWQMVSICSIRAEYRTRTNHINWRPLFCLIVYLNAGGLCTKKDVRLTQYVIPSLLVHYLLRRIKPVSERLGWSSGSIQSCEIVIGGLNIRTRLNGIAHADEDVFHLLTYLLNEAERWTQTMT